MTEKNYIFNLETTKIELHFEKIEYDLLSDGDKSLLRSAFLFSGKNKCWVSRAKEPNLDRAKQVASKLGFAEEVREGERLSFAEQLQKKAERAEERAERFETYADTAQERQKALQKPLNDMHGDIAFFTQPIIAGHSGSQAFAKRREKLFERYEKGFEEYRKSEYFRGRADIARSTAGMEKLKDKGYLDRKVKECQKEIRDRKRNIEHYEDMLVKCNEGKPIKRYGGDLVTVDDINKLLERELELIEVAQDKEGFFLNCIDDMGGIAYSFDNINKGDIVTVKRTGEVEVIGKGKQNITYKILTGGAKGMTLKASYAEITGVVGKIEKVEKQPFEVGEEFKAREATFVIVKASDKSITLKEQGTEKPAIVRKPKKCFNDNWAFSINERYGNTFYKVVNN